MKIRRIIFLVCLVGFSLVIVLFLNLNNIIKNYIEQTLTQSLAVTTTLKGTILNPFNGYLELNGLEISNPSGFSSSKFLQIQNFTIQLQPHSLLSERVEIEKLQINGVSIDIEQQIPDNNVQKIFGSAEKHKESGKSSQEKKFSLRSASINDTLLKLSVVQFGVVLGSVSASLPQVELKNLNSENYQNLLMSDLFTKLVSSVFKNAVEQNKSNIPKEILNILKQQKLITALPAGSDHI